MFAFRFAVAAALAASLACAAARADTVKFNATLEPDQQGKPGKGSAALSLDTQSKTLSGTIEYSGLAKPPAMAAFLAPPPKQNADPVTLPIPLPGNTASPIAIKMQLGDPQIAGLKTGEWLLLIGTKQGPEIGGEVKPAP